MNSLGEMVDSAKTRQKEVIELVNLTTKNLQEKNLNFIACKTNLEKSTNEVNFTLYFYVYN